MATPSNIIIRPWLEDYCDAAATLHHSVMDSPWSIPQWQAINSARNTVYMALKGDTLVGVVVFSSVVDEAELQTIAVEKSLQGQGIGKAMFMRGLQDLESKCVVMFLEVDSENHAAIAMYETLKFSVCGQRRAYYKNSRGSGDALIMKKEMNNAPSTN